MANVILPLWRIFILPIFALLFISNGMTHAQSTLSHTTITTTKKPKDIEHLLLNAHDVFQYSPLKHLEHASQLYQQTQFDPLWFERLELTEAGHALIQALKETALDQPDRSPYHIHHILYQLQSFQKQSVDVAHLDLLMTDAFLMYASDALSGALIPNTNEPDHPTLLKTALAQQISPFGALSDPLEAPNTAQLPVLTEPFTTESLHRIITETLTPQHAGYLKLRDAMEHYLHLSHAHDWPALLINEPLKFGDHHPLIPNIKKRLALLGDEVFNTFEHIPTEGFLKPEDRDFNTALNNPLRISPLMHQTLENKTLFDQALLNNLKHFQKRHGLDAHGIFDTATQNALNVPPAQRLKQIAVNMKRWRYLPKELGDRYIMTNMADYRLSVIDQNKTTLTMDIIVGRQSRRTPILVQNLKTLVLNPSWSIPPRIASSIYLPPAKKNPDYLAAQNIEIVRGTGSKRRVIDPHSLNWDRINLERFPYRLEQKAGTGNSLGEVKYPLNNDFAIYLHDTSKPKLFEREMRALSSGCIRVSKPRRLTEELLKYNPGWDGDRIARAHKRKKTMYVGLKKETPVYLMYWTAWVDEQGIVQFREDIYGRDRLDQESSTITM